MTCGEAREHSLCRAGQLEAYDAAVCFVGDAANEVCCLCAIDEPDGAVVSQEEVVGDLANRRAARFGVAPHREDQLMLRWSDAEDLGLSLAPP